MDLKLARTRTFGLVRAGSDEEAIKRPGISAEVSAAELAQLLDYERR